MELFSETQNKREKLLPPNSTENTGLVSVFHQNVQSITDVIDNLEDIIENLDNLKAICITEHWRTFQQLQNNNIVGFQLSSAFCRSEYKRGVSTIFLKKGIQYQERTDIVELSIEKILEVASIDIKIGPKNITII